MVDPLHVVAPITAVAAANHCAAHRQIMQIIVGTVMPITAITVADHPAALVTYSFPLPSHAAIQYPPPFLIASRRLFFHFWVFPPQHIGHHCTYHCTPT
jgi:hypothetical protein